MDMKAHLAQEHQMTPFSTYLREIVYGGNDGIVTTFAVVAGFTGAQQSLGAGSYALVLLFGLANLFADGTSMSLGSLLSVRAEQDVYRAQKGKELHEIRHEPHLELEETVQILKENGYSPADAVAMAKLYAKNEKYWADFMMHHELEMSNPELHNPWKIGLATFLSFVIFGAIPLVPYAVAGNDPNVFALSVFFTALALVLLGVLRWRVTTHNLARALGETILIGGVSACVAFFVGTLFRG